MQHSHKQKPPRGLMAPAGALCLYRLLGPEMVFWQFATVGCHSAAIIPDPESAVYPGARKIRAGGRT
jgi:hypothetical protein